MYNFKDTRTGQHIFIPIYRTKIVKGVVRYYTKYWHEIKDIEKLEKKVTLIGIKTPTISK